MTALSASDDLSKWDMINAPHDDSEMSAWMQERKKHIADLTIRDDNGDHYAIEFPLKNGEMKKGEFERVVRQISGDSRKIWFTEMLGCSPGFLKSFSFDELKPFITLSDRVPRVYINTKKDEHLTDFEIDPSIIKKVFIFTQSS